VGVGADADPVGVLAEVQVAVLVAQDRRARLGRWRRRAPRPGRCGRTGGPSAAAGPSGRPARRSAGPRSRWRRRRRRPGRRPGRCGRRSRGRAR
jgi:hypothetical protein